MYDLDIMEGVKFEDMMDWIQGLQGMEDIGKPSVTLHGMTQI